MEFDWSAITGSLGFLAEGMGISALLVAVATVGGLVLGFGLAMLRLSPRRWLSAPAGAYVTLMRSVPLVLMLFWFYFLVPLAIGRPIGALASALVAFVLFEAAFYCEIVRAGIRAVPPGQSQAAAAAGMRPFQAMRLVVLPQALRAMVPLVLSQVIIVFQDTSLVYVVALRDFMTAASVVAARDGRAVEMYTAVAVVYFAICFTASQLIGRRRPVMATR